MITYAQSRSGQSIQLEYEDALVGAGARVPIYCRLVRDLLWSEIDNEDHFQHASERVYPVIMHRDGPLKRSPKQ